MCLKVIIMGFVKRKQSSQLQGEHKNSPNSTICRCVIPFISWDIYCNRYRNLRIEQTKQNSYDIKFCMLKKKNTTCKWKPF